MAESDQEKVQRYERLLIEAANQLHRWSNEAVGGGWSTIHVGPMRQLSDKLHKEMHK
jgi:hypothetical protein